MITIRTMPATPGKKAGIGRSGFLKYFDLYLIMAPCLLYFIIFKYIPMGGIIMAFKNYNISQGIFGSPWAGFDHFVELFKLEQFYKVLRNTLIISLYKLVVSFPAPIMLALMLNEVRNRPFKRIVQTVTYFPNFISWVVVYGILTNLLSLEHGLLNMAIKSLGGEPVFFLGDNRFFRSVLVFGDMWKWAGIESIIYLSALTSIDPEQYEAARIDGAGRIQQILHITLPGISTTIAIMLIITLGNILDVGHEEVIVLYNPVVYETGDVITTYVYRVGIGMMKYSFTTAVGLFMSVVGFILVYFSNKLSKKIGDYGIW